MFIGHALLMRSLKKAQPTTTMSFFTHKGRLARSRLRALIAGKERNSERFRARHFLPFPPHRIAQSLDAAFASSIPARAA